MAFKMKYNPNKKTGAGFPYKEDPSPNKFIGRFIKKVAGGGIGRGISSLMGFGGGGGAGGMGLSNIGNILGGGIGSLFNRGRGKAAAHAQAQATSAQGNVDEYDFADAGHPGFAKKEEPKKKQRLSAKQIIKNKPK